MACDDTYAPDQYFGFYRIPRVQVRVVPSVDGECAASHVLARLLEFEYEDGDQRWMLLDTDHYATGSHLGSYKEAIQKARRSGIQVAISKPCFELWLLLHHLNESELPNLSNAKDVVQVLKEILGSYQKTALKREHYPARLVAEACMRAERLDQSVGSGDPPTQNTTRVYKLWKEIVAGLSPAQVPSELRGLYEFVQFASQSEKALDQ